MRAALLLLFCVRMMAAAEPGWAKLQEETLRHFQALVRLDTSDPPGNEAPAVEYLKKVLEAEGIPCKVFALEARRPNLVARLKGTGAKRPLLIMSHTDVVNVQPENWTQPPFSAARAGGYIYGRGTIDDKDNLVAALMVMLELKRLNVPLERDVIFLAESGEEGNTRVGIEYMVREHWSEIEAEFCLAEGGRVLRKSGKMSRSLVATTEKTPAAIRLISSGTAGHGSVPLPDNAIGRLGQAIARVAAYRTPMRLNDTTRTYFERLATISTPEEAARYNNLVDPERSAEIQEYLRLNEPMHYSMLRTSLSATMVRGGTRKNVIPSQAEATFDVRVAPGEDLEWLRGEIEKTVADPNVRVALDKPSRPPAPPSRLDTALFKAIEEAQRRLYPGAPVLPVMSTGASDKVYLQQRGVQCYGIGSLSDEEDAALGFGAHSDQERIIEAELYRFVTYNWDVVTAVAAAK
ncbi:MAG: M20/M25/M40 family metallo-hydrolase [Candidatus Solibacter usitatus]|nr:M20/M25/M40 family metallo-hydrolase [Candidatus Solibacter usitatus]